MGESSSSPLSKGSYYLSGLLVPHQPAQDVLFLKDLLREETGITAPMPPLLPLRVDSIPVKQPLTGYLPAADRPLRSIGLKIVNNEWIIWEWNAGNWLELLAESLGGTENSAAEELFPLSEGIPLAPLPAGSNSHYRSMILSRMENQLLTREKVNKKTGWRTMELACWKIETATDRPWYMAVAWQMLWRRRLKRGPSQANIDKTA